MNSRQRYETTYGPGPDADAFTRHIEHTYGPPLPPPRDLIDDLHTARTGEADRQRLDLKKSDAARREFQRQARLVRLAQWLGTAAYNLFWTLVALAFCGVLGWALVDMLSGAGQ